MLFDLMELHPLQSVLVAILAGITIALLGYYMGKYRVRYGVLRAEDRSRRLIEDAQREAEARRREADIEAKDLLLRTRAEFEKETKSRREESAKAERRFLQREDNLDRKVDIIDRKEKDIMGREKSLITKEKTLEEKDKKLDSLIGEEKQQLQRVAGLGAEEAKKLLLSRMESEVRNEANLMIRRTEEAAKEVADKKAREIVTLAIQKCAADHTGESTVSVLNLPNDEMKGRIIGREGRNIRALEKATGIDVIIDDTPGAVILSGFDMIRREIARLALEKLIADGRIHPARIEEVVEKVKKDMEITIREEGKKAAYEAGISGLHAEIIRFLGKLKYRTSYGQNVLEHSKETASLMGIMAGELHLDISLAKRIGLLHDLGKAADRETEGPHAKIGADLARRYKESTAVIHALEAHHEEVEAKTLMAVLVQAADAISATRPGARRETLESYIERLEKLEAIANSFAGVEKSYAIQAGREIRVIVRPNELGDQQSAVLARDISKKIEGELEYPGQVKVTVVREIRAVEYAK